MRVIRYKVLESTNLKAKELTKKGAESWTVVVSESQSGGYGRKRDRWFSPKGGLYFSIILPKSKSRSEASSLRGKLEDLQTLTMLAAFIVAKAMKDNFGVEPFIKLPNDVWLNGKKIAGILTENVVGKEVESSIMGIGLDTNIEKFPEELQDKATSLKIELGRKVDNKEILKQIVKQVEAFFNAIDERH